MGSTKDETPTFEQVLIDAVNAGLVRMNTMMPGHIISYDGARAEVEPHFIRQLRDGTEESLPVLKNVPVQHPRTASAGVRLPVKKGDKGALVFAQRSLDLWKLEGKKVNPQDPRRHNLTDAVFVPGLYPLNDNLDYDESTLDISNADTVVSLNEDGTITAKNGTSTLKINPDGTFSLNNGQFEFVTLLDRILDKVIALKVITSIGPQPLWPQSITDLTQAKTDLGTFKE